MTILGSLFWGHAPDSCAWTWRKRWKNNISKRKKRLPKKSTNAQHL